MSDSRLDGALDTIHDLTYRMGKARRIVVALQAALGGMPTQTHDQFEKIIALLNAKDK